MLANDSNIDGDNLSVSAFDAMSFKGGTVVMNLVDGSFTYHTPPDNFSGTDTFNYTANDGVLDSNIASVSIFVDGGTMHIGDLDSAVTDLGTTWRATASMTVHDSKERLVPNAGVAAIFDMNKSGTQSGVCTTDQLGAPCTLTVNVPRKTRSVIFTVLGVTGAVDYDSSANHDPDGDSDGTSMTIFRP